MARVCSIRISTGQRHAVCENLIGVLAVGLFAAWLCFIPPSLLGSSDYLVLWKPSFQFLKDAIREGRIPLWNPYLHLGRPYAADMANMAFYLPTHLICLGEVTGFFLQVWLHCLLAFYGMRKLAEVLLVGRWQSYLTAFTFVASGALTARWAAGQLPNCWAICYLPWLFYCAARTSEPWDSRRVAWYAVLMALQLLCHPQVFWFSAFGQVVFIVVRAVRLPLRETFREAGRGLGQFGAACAWCAGLVSVALLPFLELVKESNRSANSRAFTNSFNLDCSDLVSLFGPLRSGTFWESNFFVGTLIVVLGLAGLGLLRERNVRGLLGVLVVGLLIALGDKTPCFEPFYRWLPGYAGFRFHSRAAVVAVLALICASGIWLSRPHPRLSALWIYLFGVPARWAIVLLVVLQSLDLLQGTGMVAGVITRACCIDMRTPLERSFEEALVAELRKANLIGPSLAPPRVSVRPSFVPADYGMIHHYSHYDAGCALSLCRPWDYLHAVLGLTPDPGKSGLPSKVYDLGPFPYPDLNLSAGFDLRALTLVVVTNPSPRAFLVYAAEVVGDYSTILQRLAGGHEIHRAALLESVLPQPLPPASVSPGAAAVIRRFEPNWLLVEVDASTNGLLVVAEAWHPGWRAEVDGQAVACVPANIWMRAVPVPAGRHWVRLYYHQNYLLPGLAISLVSIGLFLVAVAKRGRCKAQRSDHPDTIHPVAAPRASERGRREAPAEPPCSYATALSRFRPLARALAAVVGLVLIWLVAIAETQQVRRFLTLRSQMESRAHSRMGGALALQRQIPQASAHYLEALRLAECACRLTGYREPKQLETLAWVYGDVGDFDRAVATAKEARDFALASGQDERADQLLKFILACDARKSASGK